MEKFSYYLLGKRFTLKSDSEALKFIIEDKKHKDIGKRTMSRAGGWLLRLEHFMYTFEHVAGTDNIADPASRICVKKDDPEYCYGKEPQELFSVTANPEDIKNQYFAIKNVHIEEELRKDEQTVIKWLNVTEKWPIDISRYQAFQKVMYVQGSFLIKEEKLVLPAALHKNVLVIAYIGHPRSSTMKHVWQSLWWLELDTDVEYFVRSCPQCQLITRLSKPYPIANN